MNQRILPDPHSPTYEWRVVNGVRQCRYNWFSNGSGGIGAWFGAQFDEYDSVAGWLFEHTPERLALCANVFVHTPERVAVWAELTLQPFEP